MLKEALFYKTLEDKKIRCLLCPKGCVIGNGQRGDCRVRLNRNRVLYTLNYEKITSLALDPIEKKPLYHFLPSSKILSIGTFGCNFFCPFCQNWEISQALESDVPTKTLSIEDLAIYAGEYGSCGVAYTYNEPSIWYEFIKDSAPLVKERSLKVVLVTNGYINPIPQKELLPYIDAMNIDLKAFSDDFYVKYTGGHLLPVLRSIEAAYNAGVHIEITNLLITGLNDSPEMIKKLIDWVHHLDPAIPLHFSRYFPAYKMTIPETPVEHVKMAYNMAQEKLHYVYMGNVWNIDANTTYCKHCGRPLIVRRGYEIISYNIESGKCKFCGEEVDGVFE